MTGGKILADKSKKKHSGHDDINEFFAEFDKVLADKLVYYPKRNGGQYADNFIRTGGMSGQPGLL